MQSPFFILGNPRSGTTMFRLMLHSHSKICVPPECGFALWWYKKYKNWKPSDGLESGLVEDIMSSRKMEYWNLDKQKLLSFLENHSPANYKEVTTLVYRFYALLNGKEQNLVGDKNTWYIPLIEDIRELYPSSKIIFIIRDGRDVACSYLQIDKDKYNTTYVPKLPTKIGDIAREWSNNNKIALTYMEKTNWANGILIRYEDLLNNSEKELTRITNFFNLPFENLMLDYYKDTSEPEEMLLWKPKTKQKPDVNNIGKYKTILSKNQISEFDSIAGGILNKFNYL